MNNLLNINPPAESIAQSRKADYNLSNHGVGNLRLAYWNLAIEALYEEAVFRGEGITSTGGPFVAHTGKHTGRSANDKFTVRHADSENHIWWGTYNRPFDGEKFDGLYTRLLGYMQSKDVFVQDVYVGADEKYRMPIRFVTEYAWHSMFIRNMFIPPQTLEEYKHFVPEFTVIGAPGFKSNPAVDGTPSETFIVLNYERKLAIIGNTAYAGETKKSIFTLLNYLLPLQGVMSMHCSANVDPNDSNDVALFFGLSGTGKTTLSADPTRRLIGDDEHGWSDNGVFNFEGGCYAKCIGLSQEKEPQIWNAIRFGTVLENVAIDSDLRELDFASDKLTENTRAAYPVEYIDNALIPGVGGHPTHILFLTADAFGVLPPISRLSPEQAMYHFLSGYTAKLAGTERGLGSEPQATFSACFGAPFLPRPPLEYARMLSEKMRKHNVKCLLVNTGWVG